MVGGAYVPIDPSYPIQRLSQIILHSRLRLATVHTDSAAWLRDAHPDVKQIAVDLHQMKDPAHLRVLPEYVGSDRLCRCCSPRAALEYPKGFLAFILALFSAWNSGGLPSRTRMTR